MGGAVTIGKGTNLALTVLLYREYLLEIGLLLEQGPVSLNLFHQNRFGLACLPEIFTRGIAKIDKIGSEEDQREGTVDKSIRLGLG